MKYIEDIQNYVPVNAQETHDKQVILNYISHFLENVLLRDNKIAHITSSGFIMNEKLDKVLFVKHNILQRWAWTGGHADGNGDLLQVAIEEAKEETGIAEVVPLTSSIASIDILSVGAHLKNERYVNQHLHLSIAYILLASEKEKLQLKEDENSGVKWIKVEDIDSEIFDDYDKYLYRKLVNQAKDKKMKMTDISKGDL